MRTTKAVKIKTKVRAGGLPDNHNKKKSVKIKTKVRAGGIPDNHNKKVV